MQVEKLWGYEDWLYNGDAGYCMKILELEPGFQSSLHYHPVKHETMLVVDGCCDMEWGGKIQRLVKGHCVILPPKMPHRFRAINGPCTIVEASSHHDDADVVRLEPSKEIK